MKSPLFNTLFHPVFIADQGFPKHKRYCFIFGEKTRVSSVDRLMFGSAVSIYNTPGSVTNEHTNRQTRRHALHGRRAEKNTFAVHHRTAEFLHDGVKYHWFYEEVSEIKVDTRRRGSVYQGRADRSVRVRR